MSSMMSWPEEVGVVVLLLHAGASARAPTARKKAMSLFKRVILSRPRGRRARLDSSQPSRPESRAGAGAPRGPDLPEKKVAERSRREDREVQKGLSPVEDPVVEEAGAHHDADDHDARGDHQGQAAPAHGDPK